MQPSKFLLLLNSMRPHQWVKNLLLFSPLLLAHKISDTDKYLPLSFAFIFMCLAASGIYLINDIVDREADRLHPVKKYRPIACGALPAGTALITALILLCASLVSAFVFVNFRFAVMLAVYGILTTAYSMILKKILMIDVIVLSFFYSLRIVAGGAASGIAVSPWFLAFSWFFFLSIAFVKRYAELRICAAPATTGFNGRGYGREDLLLIPIAGITSGLLSVLVFLLYIATSDQVKTLYTNPLWLWMIAPIFVYWLMRLWFLAQRNEMDSDPVSFAIKDAPSWVTVAIIGILLVLGSIT